MINEPRLNFLFEKYLHRTCTDAEIAELTGLLQHIDADELLSAEMHELWLQHKKDETEYAVDWEQMLSTVQQSETTLTHLIRRRYWIAAAMVLVVAGAAGLWYWGGHSKIPVAKELAKSPQRTNKSAPRTQTIHLPDGSTAILNTGSRLNYPPVFSGKLREVYLTGEAYFDVKHNARQPFLVHAGKLVTRVLGTAFDIRAYPGDELIEITVDRGRVQVFKESRSIGLVNANQQISFSKTDERYEEKTVDAKLVTSWKPHEVVFNDLTLREAAKKIEEEFNMQVVFVNPAIMDCRVTATFSDDDQPDEMLAVICGVTKTNYTIQHNKILIDGKGCNE